MPAYSFVVRNNDATEIEMLGAMALANDDAVLAFGMDVAKGKRAVGSISFDDGPDQG
jgi:hypothetical protein